MPRAAILLAALSALILPGPAFALREVIVGNQPLPPGFVADKELLAALNVEERVFLSQNSMGGSLDVYFKGGPKALNAAFRQLAAIAAQKREVIVRPGPAKSMDFAKKVIAYDWVLEVTGLDTGARRGRQAGLAVTLTVYVPEPLPPPVPDPARARAWIADLGSDDFKTRERAARELTDLGPAVAPVLRDALAGRLSPEARDRVGKIRADLSREIRPDVLEVPDGVTVVSLDDLLARHRKAMADKDPATRGHGVGYLALTGVPAEDVLPDVEKMLKTETHPSALAGAAWAAGHLGAAARPLLPLLGEAAKSADKGVASTAKQSIEVIEKAKPQPAVPEAEAKKRATIRKEIREFVEGRRKERK
jgi:hypothetical protein